MLNKLKSSNEALTGENMLNKLKSLNETLTGKDMSNILESLNETLTGKDMSNILESLNENENENEISFILDYGKKQDGQYKYEENFTHYKWNKKRFNRLYVGAYVLGRVPSRQCEDNKFMIDTGGIITHISEPDKDGFLIATIGSTFKINPPIKQGDNFIENFTWQEIQGKGKRKKQKNWRNFWSQYGMNIISFKDFLKLIEHSQGISFNKDIVSEEDINDDVVEEDINPSVLKKIEDESGVNFHVVSEETETPRKKTDTKYSGRAQKCDFEKIQKIKKEIGDLGERIVLNLLTQEANEKGWKKPEHSSKDEGDGLGFDIRYWKDDKEIHVEVKTTLSNAPDHFEMTLNEIQASQYHEYEIYRVYDLDVDKQEYKLKIYKGPIDDKRFELKPKTYIVYQK